jgi:hypothetical protein
MLEDGKEKKFVSDIVKRVQGFDLGEGYRRTKIVIAGVGVVRVGYETIEEIEEYSSSREYQAQQADKYAREKGYKGGYKSFPQKKRLLIEKIIDEGATFDYGELAEVAAWWLLFPILLIHAAEWVIKGFRKRPGS